MDINIANMRKAYFWSLLGDFFQGGSQWLVIILIARLCDPSTLGAYSLSLAYVLPLLQFFEFKLREAQASDQSWLFSQTTYFQLRLVAVVVVLIITSLIALLIVSDEEVQFILLACCVFRCTESLSDIVYGAYQREHRFEQIGKSKALKGVIGAVLGVLCLYGTHSVFSMLILMACSSIVLMLAYDGHVLLKVFERNTKESFFFRDLYKSNQGVIALLRRSWPLGILASVLVLMDSMPRLILEQMIGIEELGYFAAAASLTAFVRRAMAPVAQIILGPLAVLYIKDHRRYAKAIWRFASYVFFVGVIGVAVVINWGESIIVAVYGSAYSDNSNVLLLLTIAIAFALLASIFNSAILAANHYVKPIPGSILALTIGALISFFCIPKLGVSGAALGTLASMLVWCVYTLLISVHLSIEKIKNG